MQQAAFSARRIVPLSPVERSPLPPPDERLFGPPRPQCRPSLGPEFPDFDPKAYVDYHTSLEGQPPEQLLQHYSDRGRKQGRRAFACVPPGFRADLTLIQNPAFYWTATELIKYSFG